jgi:putative ABC transport system substrate-binding protein
MALFRRVLSEGGHIEGQNFTIEARYAEGRYEHLPEMAADLVRHRVALILATPNANVVRAAKAATADIPILFSVGGDPVKLGLVASLSHPGGNATGVNFFLNEIVAKRLDLLRELMPAASRFGVLVNPNQAVAEDVTQELTGAGTSLGVQIDVVRARNSREIEAAFASLKDNRAEALFVAPDTVFVNRRVQITTLAAANAIPAIYTVREYVEVGGLMSYGTALTEVYRQLAIYAGRILKGAKPADLPVVQSTKFELLINLPTARALHLEIPPTLLARADEVIE